jgi:hypothetical protein
MSGAKIVSFALVLAMTAGCFNADRNATTAGETADRDSEIATAEPRASASLPAASSGEPEAPHPEPVAASAQPPVTIAEPTPPRVLPPTRPTDKQPAVFSAAITPSSAAPGDEVTLIVTAVIAPGWHIYALNRSNGVNIPTALKLALSDEISPAGEWTAPTPEVLPTELGPSSIYHEEAVFSRRLRLNDKMAAGTANISCEVSYQTCDRSRCMPPDETIVSASLEVVSSQEP